MLDPLVEFSIISGLVGVFCGFGFFEQPCSGKSFFLVDSKYILLTLYEHYSFYLAALEVFRS